MMQSRRGAFTASAFTLSALVLAACGGGGAGTSLAPTIPAPAATNSVSGQTLARVVIAIPPKAASTARTRKPEYVSASTQSITVKVDSGTPVAQNLTPGSANCNVPAPLSPLTCTVDVVAAPGSHTFTFTTYDQTSAAGNQLSVNSVTQSLVANQVNLIDVTLAGVPKALQVAPIAGAAGISGDQTSGIQYFFGAARTIAVAAMDADGNYIVGPGAPVLSVSVTGGTSGANIAIAAAANGNPNDFVLNATSAGTATLAVTAAPASALAGGNLVVNVALTSTVLVSTIDGNSFAGFKDGPGCSSCSSLTAYAMIDSNPTGITYDSVDGNLYFTDSMACSVRQVQLAAPNIGYITSFAGAASGSATCGSLDGTGVGLSAFTNPEGIAYDAGNGNFYVADTYNCTIRQVTSGATITTIAGTNASCVWLDGTGASARFIDPIGIAYDASDGNLYVGDNCAIRQVTPGGVVTTIAGSSTCGYTDGTGGAAQFGQVAGIAYDSGDHNLYVTDSADCAIRRVTTGGVVTTIAGAAPPTATCTITDGTGSAARFAGPRGIVYDPNDGNLYVTDNSILRQVTSSGIATSIAGAGPSRTQWENGLGTVANFPGPPTSLAFDSSNGMLYILDGYHLRQVQL